MSREKTNTTKLGLFVTAALALFILGVYNIGERKNMFGSTFSVSAVFQNVHGLQAGNNVRYAGINVGSVDQILILNDSTLQVDMLLEKKVKNFLKKDAIASIGSDGLVGSMIINIRPGNGRAKAVEDGDFISSFARVETEEMLSKLGNTTENIGLLTLNLLEVAEKMNEGTGTVSTLINDDALANELRLAIQNLRKTTQHVNALSSQLQTSMELVNQGQGVLGYLLKDSTFETKINRTVDNLDSLIIKRTIPIMDYLHQSSADIATTSKELKNIIQQIDLNKGLAGSMLNDSILSEDFKQTMKNLNKGSELLNEDLEALQHNFLFRRYFKKKKKKEKKKKDLSVVQGD